MYKILLFRKIDKYIGDFICVFLYLFKLLFKNKQIGNPRRILIVKIWAIGESVLVLPLIDALNKHYSGSSIDVLVRNQNKDVFIDNQLVGKINLFERSQLFKLFLSFRSYDLVVDAEPFFRISAILSFWLGKYVIGFSHGLRSLLYDKKIKYNDQQHVVQTYLDIARSFGINTNYNRLMPLGYKKEDEISINNLLKKLRNDKCSFLVGIAPGSSESAQGRRWNWKNFLELSKRLVNEFNCNIVFVGDKNDARLVEKIYSNDKKNFINLTGKISLKQFFYLVEKFKIFISNDSGPMHIAAAQGVKTLGLFGPNTPIRFAPYGPGNRYIYKSNTPPSINVHKGEIPLHIKSTSNMDKITVNEVYKEVKNILSK